MSKICITDSEERKLIISFFIVKYSKMWEVFLLVLLNDIPEESGIVLC